jgi:hypothetical protein
MSLWGSRVSYGRENKPRIISRALERRIFFLGALPWAARRRRFREENSELGWQFPCVGTEMAEGWVRDNVKFQIYRALTMPHLS